MLSCPVVERDRIQHWCLVLGDEVLRKLKVQEQADSQSESREVPDFMIERLGGVYYSDRMDGGLYKGRTQVKLSRPYHCAARLLCYRASSAFTVPRIKCPCLPRIAENHHLLPTC